MRPISSRKNVPLSASRTLYRSRKGLIFGVCRGLADYADIHVT
ncbi:MAG: PspC domain-containing protein [Opitutales bacterium]